MDRLEVGGVHDNAEVPAFFEIIELEEEYAVTASNGKVYDSFEDYNEAMDYAIELVQSVRKLIETDWTVALEMISVKIIDQAQRKLGLDGSVDYECNVILYGQKLKCICKHEWGANLREDPSRLTKMYGRREKINGEDVFIVENST